MQFHWGRSNYLIPFSDTTSHEVSPDRSKTLQQLRGGSRHTFRIDGGDHDIYRTGKRGESYNTISSKFKGIRARDLLKFNKDYHPRYTRVTDKISRGTFVYCSEIPRRVGGEDDDEEEDEESEDIALAGKINSAHITASACM